jgi:hypothetical protein
VWVAIPVLDLKLMAVDSGEELYLSRYGRPRPLVKRFSKKNCYFSVLDPLSKKTVILAAKKTFN